MLRDVVLRRGEALVDVHNAIVGQGRLLTGNGRCFDDPLRAVALEGSARRRGLCERYVGSRGDVCQIEGGLGR